MNRLYEWNHRNTNAVRMHFDGEGWMEYDACFGAFIGTELSNDK